MKRTVFLASALGALLCAGGVTYVDELDLSAATCGAGKKVAARQSVDGHPITLAGKVYARGIGTHPEGCVAFAANGKVTSFEAMVGIDDDAKTAGSGKSYGKPTAEFRVWADGKVVWRSGERKLGQDPRPGPDCRERAARRRARDPARDDRRRRVDRVRRRELRLGRRALHVRGRRGAASDHRPRPHRAARHPHPAREGGAADQRRGHLGRPARPSRDLPHRHVRRASDDVHGGGPAPGRDARSREGYPRRRRAEGEGRLRHYRHGLEREGLRHARDPPRGGRHDRAHPADGVEQLERVVLPPHRRVRALLREGDGRLGPRRPRLGLHQPRRLVGDEQLRLPAART